LILIKYTGQTCLIESGPALRFKSPTTRSALVAPDTPSPDTPVWGHEFCSFADGCLFKFDPPVVFKIEHPAHTRALKISVLRLVAQNNT
jgi:hypothetical protein